MSQTQDDYGLIRGNPEGIAASHGREPADPPQVDLKDRQRQPLTPESVKVDRLPEPLTDGERPLTVKEARESYLQTQRASWTADGRTSKYERHRYGVYPRILGADRHFREEYDGLTTVMLTRRLSPLDNKGDWLTPWECNEMLHGGSIHKSIRQTLNYQLGDFTFEWVGVTAPTRSAGTPHEHIYIWIEDPENEVGLGHMAPALGKHLKYCANAYEKHHRCRGDGTDGAITVNHSPNLTNLRFREAGSTDREKNTVGAQYLASQLVHLSIGDFYDNECEDPPNTLLEGGALAWASPYSWFRASKGVPEAGANFD